MVYQHIRSLPFTLSLLLSLLAVQSSLADETCRLFNKPFTATYYGSYKGWRVDATQRLAALPDGRWQFTLNANNPVGSINQQSIFTLANNALTSERYRHERKVLVKNNISEIHFNWKNQQATSQYKDNQYKIKLQGGELDDLNYQLVLRCDLLSGKTEFHYPVIDHQEIDMLDFKVVGEEKLDTELGSLNTVVVKRIRNNNNRITTLWFAKDMDYQMVKLLQEERKDTEAYLLYIKSLSH